MFWANDHDEKSEHLHSLWAVVLDLKWEKDFDFERTRAQLPKLCKKHGVKREDVRAICNQMVGILKDKVEKYVDEEKITDFYWGDRIDDLLWHIVGYGPGAFTDAMANPHEIIAKWRDHLAPESFAYSFQAE
jgi:hypothetical protein